MKHKRTAGGFTILELVVILAILTILAAFFIATLSGYINKAGETSLIADCRSCVICAKTMLVNDYAKSGEYHIPLEEEVAKTAEVSGSVSDITISEGDILTLTYTSRDNKRSVVYSAKPSIEYEIVYNAIDEPPEVLTKDEAIEKTVEELKDFSVEKARTNIYSTNPNDRYGNYEALKAILPKEVMNALSDTVYTVTTDQYGAASKLIIFNGTKAEFDAASSGVSVTLYDIKTGQTSQKRGSKGTSEFISVLTDVVW